MSQPIGCLVLVCFLLLIHPSSWDKGSPFPPPFGIIAYERKPLNDKPRLQVPCRGRRPAGHRFRTSRHWPARVRGRMSRSPARLLLPSCRSTSPLCLFLVQIIFKPSILFVCRLLKKEWHSVMSKSSGWCGRQGGASKMLNTCTILYHL